MRSEPATPIVRSLASGPGWRVSEVICHAGPGDRPFEERRDWVSIAAVLDGTFTYRSAHGRALMVPGSLLLGSAGQCFECGHDHGTGDRCITFQFAPAVFEDIARGLRTRSTVFRTSRVPPFGGLLPAFPTLARLCTAADPLLAEALAIDLAAAALCIDQDTGEAPVSLRDEARIGTALQVIRESYRNGLTIAGLATVCGLSRRRFAAVFRRVVGVTPYQYVLDTRLRAAAEQLRQGEASVLQVALDCGFGDLSEFTRRFRQRFGVPPGRFRRART